MSRTTARSARVRRGLRSDGDGKWTRHRQLCAATQRRWNIGVTDVSAAATRRRAVQLQGPGDQRGRGPAGQRGRGIRQVSTGTTPTAASNCPADPNIPGVSRRFVESLKSPNVSEVGWWRESQLRQPGRGPRGLRLSQLRLTSTADRSVDRQGAGPLGPDYDLTLIENTNGVERKYTGSDPPGTYRLGRRIDVGGNYTLSRAWGNFNGEDA